MGACWSSQEVLAVQDRSLAVRLGMAAVVRWGGELLEGPPGAEVRPIRGGRNPWLGFCFFSVCVRLDDQSRAALHREAPRFLPDDNAHSTGRSSGGPSSVLVCRCRANHLCGSIRLQKANGRDARCLQEAPDLCFKWATAASSIAEAVWLHLWIEQRYHVGSSSDAGPT